MGIASRPLSLVFTEPAPTREDDIRERAERGAYGYESDGREDTFFLLARIGDLREQVAEYVAAFGPMDFVARGKIKRPRDA